MFIFFTERGVFTVIADSTAMPSVHDPLDDGSFLYFIRTLPLTVGETYSFDRYFRPDRNPVTIKVLRKEHIKVPAGEFDAIVVQPDHQGQGHLLGERPRRGLAFRRREPHHAADEVEGLSFGSINLYLKSYRPARARRATTKAPQRLRAPAQSATAQSRGRRAHIVPVAVRHPSKVSASATSRIRRDDDMSFGAFRATHCPTCSWRDFARSFPRSRKRRAANGRRHRCSAASIVKTGPCARCSSS